MSKFETALEVTIKNLKVVQKELPKLAKQWPEIIENFDMSQFGGFAGATKEQYMAESVEHECNTHGCLLGSISLLKDNFPALPSMFEEHWLKETKHFSYEKFSDVYFPLTNKKWEERILKMVTLPDIIGQEMDTSCAYVWFYLFGSCHAYTNPTFEDAMTRIGITIIELQKELDYLQK